MPTGLARGTGPLAEVEQITNSAGDAFLRHLGPTTGLVAFARAPDGRLGWLPLDSLAAYSEIVVRAGERFGAHVVLADGRAPIGVHGVLSTRHPSGWRVAVRWDEAAGRVYASEPVILDAFDLHIDAIAHEQVEGPALPREFHYRAQVRADAAHGTTVVVPRR